MYDAYCLAY